MKVCKFGGSSLASATQMKKTADIVLSDPLRQFIVVSAPGKRYPGDQKVTDLLIELATVALKDQPYFSIQREIINRFSEIIIELNLDRNLIRNLEGDLQTRIKQKTLSAPKFMDLIKACGEDYSALIFARYLKQRGAEAHYLNPWTIGMILSDQPGNARLLPSSYQKLNELAHIPSEKGLYRGVIPGFFGYTVNGEVVTFARGGSDITGSIVAASIDAELYENFTDVDSVFVADPKIIASPQPISEITYKEMRELSYAGFSVLHEEALEPLYKKGIPVVIKNTNNPNSPGTVIIAEHTSPQKTLSGIAGQSGFASIYLGKYLMNREIGFGRKLLQILEEEQISFDHTPSGIDNISVIIDSSQLTKTLEEKLLNRFKNELMVDYVDITKNLAVIMLVGENILTNGVISKATEILQSHGIEIKILSKATFSVSLMLGIDGSLLNQAIKLLYDGFYNPENGA